MQISKTVHSQSQKTCCEHIWSKIANFFQKKKKDRLAAFFYKSILRRKSKIKSQNIPDFL